jgi:multidrug efflux pump subunit AcrA (membrane-fusion protein)
MKSTDQEGEVYRPVPGDKQREATRFIIDQVFTDVAWLNQADILSRIEGSGAIARVQRVQAANLTSLLSPARMVRMTEAALVDEDAYSLMEYFEDLREGIWTELETDAPIDTYRRSLQRTYLEQLAALMEDRSEAGSASDAASRAAVVRSDIRPLVRAQLNALRTTAEAAEPSDAITRYHLQDIVARIDDILEG